MGKHHEICKTQEMGHIYCGCKADSIRSADKPFWIICNVCDAVLVSRVMSVGRMEAKCGGRSTPLLLIEGYEDHVCQKKHIKNTHFFIIKSGDEMETAEELLIGALSGSLVGAS